MFRLLRKSAAYASVILILLESSIQLLSADLIGVNANNAIGTTDSNLVDIDVTNGDSNRRNFPFGDLYAALAMSSSGTLFGSVDFDHGGFNATIAADHLVTIDPVSAQFTTVGPFGTDVSVTGLAFDSDGALFGADDAADALVAINPTTGAATRIGLFGTSDINSLAFNSSNELFGVDSELNMLFSIDTNSGQATPIGPLGVSLIGFRDVQAVAFDSGVLYGIDTIEDAVLQINTQTGQATAVTGIGSGQVIGLTSSGLLPGDVNQDGEINFLDISPFITTLSVGGDQAEADVNEDGMVDFLDISPFIELLSSQ